MQESQKVRFKHAVEEEVKKEAMRPLSQTSPMKDASEQSSIVVIPPSFSSRFTRFKEEEEEREILEMFHKIEKLNGNEKICMGENTSAILQ